MVATGANKPYVDHKSVYLHIMHTIYVYFPVYAELVQILGNILICIYVRAYVSVLTQIQAVYIKT